MLQVQPWETVEETPTEPEQRQAKAPNVLISLQVDPATAIRIKPEPLPGRGPVARRTLPTSNPSCLARPWFTRKKIPLGFTHGGLGTKVL